MTAHRKPSPPQWPTATLHAPVGLFLGVLDLGRFEPPLAVLLGHRAGGRSFLSVAPANSLVVLFLSALVIEEVDDLLPLLLYDNCGRTLRDALFLQSALGAQNRPF